MGLFSIFSDVYIVVVFVMFLYVYFCFFKLLLSGDIEVNPGPRHHPKKCRILYSNVRGLHKNKKDLDLAAEKFDIVFCSETLVSDLRHISELLVPGFKKPTLVKRNAILRARGMALYIRDGFSASHKPMYECKCHETLVAKVSGRLINLYIFGSYRNPDLDDTIYDCLLSKMMEVQNDDPKAHFVFVGDYNAHHTEWLNSVTATDVHGRVARDFATISGCEQLVREPTHLSGNPLDLVFTDVSELVNCRVGSPVGTSDHSQVKISVELEQVIPEVNFSRKVYLKSRADWNGIYNDLYELNWGTIYRNQHIMECLNNHFVTIIDRRIPSKILRFRLKDKPWFNAECKLAYHQKQEAYHLWRGNRSDFLWRNFTILRRQAQEVYERAERTYNEGLKENLLSSNDDHKWWSTLKSSLFGVDSSMPPLVRSNGTTVYSPGEKAELLADVFDRKQSSESVLLPQSCFPEPRLCSLAFRSKEVKLLLLELDSHGGMDPNGILPIFLKKTADYLAPKITTIFRKLVRIASFPHVWRTGNIAALPKGLNPSSSPSEYRPISITPILSKIYEKLLSRRLCRYAEDNNLLPAFQFGFRKGLGTCDALLSLSTILQGALDVGAEARMVGLDFSAAFDRVNHWALIYKLKLLGVGGPFINILSEFLLGRTQRVCIDGQCSSVRNVISGVPQGSVLGPLLFIIYTSDMWQGLENKLIAYADDATLLATVRSPLHRTEVADSLNRDLARISNWCRLWGMKLNPSKTQSMTISRSRTLFPLHPDLHIDGTVLSDSNSFKILGVTFDKKLTFEKHIRNIASSVSQKIGILRRCFKIFNDTAVIMKCFNAFLLPCLEYCSPVWSSGADSHLKLLDKVMSSIKFILPSIHVDLWHRRKVSSLCLLHKMYYNAKHPLNLSLPALAVFARNTRLATAANSITFSSIRTQTNQCARSFMVATTKLWNGLPCAVVESSELQTFKKHVNSFLLTSSAT